MRRATMQLLSVIVPGLLATACASAPPESPPAAPAQIEIAALGVAPADFADLPGWLDGAHERALAAFVESCDRFSARPDDAPVGPPYAGAVGPWKAACADAASVPLGRDAARAFFEARFEPVALTAADGAQEGLTTAYYEPEIEARRAPEPPFTEPMLRAPYNLVVLESPAIDTYARGVRREAFIREPDGAFTLAPPRGAIRRDALAVDAIGYGRLSDVVFLQIQGSGRLVFPDGARVRAAFAATNTRPYSSIARDLAATGAMPLESASNARVKAWLDAADPVDADAVVNANERYVYFREEALGPSPPGPRGAAGAPLTGHASIAIDPDWHAYGTLFWIAPAGEDAPAARLGVAQDTGGAITGPLRSDLFFGTGEAAGEAAAQVRHRTRWWALVPVDQRIAAR
ncbi:MAG: MltA domain-containing protein [Maricaulaceae bacterium]|jgi:membrane-bound lytic murein transglycosylase A